MVPVPVPTFKKLWAGWFHTIIHIYVTDSWVLRAQPEIHRQNVDRVLGFFFSRPNWDTPTPSPAGDYVLPSFGWGGGGGDTHSLRERGWGVPIPTRGQTLWYFRYLPIHVYALCVHRHGGGTLCTDNMHICVRSSLIANFLRTLFVSKSQSWCRAALKMRMRKNFRTKKIFSGLWSRSGSETGSRSETNFRLDLKRDPKLLFRIRNTVAGYVCALSQLQSLF